MTRRYTTIGVVITILYLLLLLIFLHSRINTMAEMRLNEIGDFLAGIFGPVAFLWLVLGYFQQGIELKQNTKALELQAEELKHSVEQQRAMVEVSRQQFETELETLQYERKRIEEAALPKFIKNGFGGMHRGDGTHEFHAEITNLGATVTNISLLLSEPAYLMGLNTKPFWSSNETIRVTLGFRDQAICDCTIYINYQDGIGRPGKAQYEIVADFTESHPHLNWKS